MHGLHVDQKLRISSDTADHKTPISPVMAISSGSRLPTDVAKIIYQYTLSLRQLLVNPRGGYAALLSEGAVETWGYDLYGGDTKGSPWLQSDILKIFAHEAGFSVVTSRGEVVSWGHTILTPPKKIMLPGGHNMSNKVRQIVRTHTVGDTRAGEYYALSNDGEVFYWEDSWEHGRSATLRYSNVKMIQISTSQCRTTAIAILFGDGHVDTINHETNFGRGKPVPVPELQNIISISSTETGLFTAVDADGKVTTWGGRRNPTVTNDATLNLRGGVENMIYSNFNSFAAIDVDGKVTTWGRCSGTWGYDAINYWSHGIDQLFPSAYSFSTVTRDRKIQTWGTGINQYDRVSIGLPIHLQPGQRVRNIYGTREANAALLTDGSAITWGDRVLSGFTAPRPEELNGGVIDIVANDFAFAALKQDGTVVTWGLDQSGGNSSTVQDKLVNVRAIYSDGTLSSFVAVTSTGAIVYWGRVEVNQNRPARVFGPPGIWVDFPETLV